MAIFWDQLTVFSLSILTYSNLVISHYGFEGRALVLITSVPGHCLSFAFFNSKLQWLGPGAMVADFSSIDNLHAGN